MSFNFSGVEVFWDNDATLVDSEIIAMPHAVHSVLAELKNHGIDHGVGQEEFDELVVKWAGKQISQMMAIMEQRYGISLTEAQMESFCKDDAKRVIEALHEVKAIDGIHEALAEIQDEGGRNSVVTSSSLARVMPGLENNNLLQYFGDVGFERVWSANETLEPIYGVAVPKSSEHPEIYQYAIDQTGAKPGARIAIEDSGSGVGAAIAAEVPVVGLVAASHIADPEKHALGLKNKVKETLRKRSNGRVITEGDIDAKIEIVTHPQDIPNAIAKLLDLKPFQPESPGRT